MKGYFVLPGSIDDPRAPSGGNTYDRRVCQGLPGITEVPVREQAALATALAAIPDGAVVLLDGLIACGVPEILRAEADRLKLAVLVHLPLGDETGHPPDEVARLSTLERQALRLAKVVIATSVWAGQRLVALHGLPPDRVRVAAPGVDAAPLAAGSDGAAQLLCVASVTPRKGQDVLVQALAQLTDLPWRCECVGGLDAAPGYVGYVRQLADRYQIKERVRLGGPQVGGELAATYAGADLMVLPSHAETYGMVVTEALARGIPVLATEVGGVPEALGRAPDGALPGMLVPPGDPSALAEALRRWLSQSSTRDRIKSAALARRATLPGWEVTTSTLASILERL